MPIAHAGGGRHTKVRKAGVVAWYGELERRILPRPPPTPAGGKPPHYIPLSPTLWIPAGAGMTNEGPERRVRERWNAGALWDAQHHFRANRSCRLPPAHQGTKSWSCGLVRRIGTAGSATSLLRPSGGQAPRLAKSSTALHYSFAARNEHGLEEVSWYTAGIGAYILFGDFDGTTLRPMLA